MDKKIIYEWIKKDDVINIIKGLPKDLWEEYIYMLKGVWCDEDMLIDVEPVRHGNNMSEYPSIFKCSECGCSDNDTYTCDCPNCGAKMDKE